MFYGIFLFYNTKKSIKINFVKNKDSKLKGSSFKEKGDVSFIILIPVLREQKIIKQTLDFFSSLNYDFSKVKIVTITSEREAIERGENKKDKLTKEIIETEIKKLNYKFNKKVFVNIHYPFSQGVKSDQLNYAIKILQEDLRQPKKTYMGVYDADSRPNKNVLKQLADDATVTEFPLVYQQPTIYLQNFNYLPNNFNGLFMKNFAIWQTQYSLGYEIPMFSKYPKLNSYIEKMRYCIGHGLFVRSDYLNNIGLFPSPIEDTRLGHILSYLEKDIRLLPSFDVVQVTESLPKLIKQTSVWFTGEATILKDLKIAKRVGEVNTIKAVFLIIHKFFKNFLWATQGLIFVSIIFFNILFLNKVALLIFLLGIFTYFYAGGFYLLSKRKEIKEITGNLANFDPEKKDFILSLIFLPLNGLLLFLGPQLGFFRLIFTNKIKLPKTER